MVVVILLLIFVAYVFGDFCGWMRRDKEAACNGNQALAALQQARRERDQYEQERTEANAKHARAMQQIATLECERNEVQSLYDGLVLAHARVMQRIAALRKWWGDALAASLDQLPGKDSDVQPQDSQAAEGAD